MTGLLLGVSHPAVAGNTHTVGPWYHGLGDAKNDDAHVHPFNHNEPGRASHNTLSLVYYRSSNNAVREFSQTCKCDHNHRDWDTSTRRECKYASVHEATGADALNSSFHFHHNKCI